MNSILFLTISIVFHLSFTSGAIEWAYETLYATSTCTGSPLSISAVQSGNCFSFDGSHSTQVTCGTSSATQAVCNSNNCASGTCSTTNVPLTQCNATTMFTGTCSASLPSFTGMAVLSEYTVANCNGAPTAILAVPSGICIGFSKYTCSGQNVTIESCSDQACTQNCQSSPPQTGCQPSGGGFDIFYSCGSANGVPISTTGSVTGSRSDASSVISNFWQVLPILLVGIAFL